MNFTPSFLENGRTNRLGYLSHVRKRERRKRNKKKINAQYTESNGEKKIKIKRADRIKQNIAIKRKLEALK